jgi:hypothetical protein
MKALMRRQITLLSIATLLTLLVASTSWAQDPIKVLVIGGQNNHNWSKSTPHLAKILNAADGITATVDNAPVKNSPASDWDAWRPDFNAYNVVLLDYNGEHWPEEVKQSFVNYVKGGGSVIVFHAANNSFRGWTEFEEMVGLLWRGTNFGYSLYVDEDGNVVREEPGEGRGMGHGSQYPWVMTTRDRDNPITKDLPLHWYHAKDELYHGQRGPAKNVNILITAYSDPAPDRRGTGKHEPMVFWVPCGRGKCLTNLMGHVGSTDPLDCVGFKTVLIRSVEWLATGKCTTPVPANFPTNEVVVEPTE